jgi:ferredoxin-NADP reductase
MNDIQRATVAAARTLTAHAREVELAPAVPVGYAPGQWISLRLPVGEKPPLNRAYSLASAPGGDGRLTLCFDRVEGGLGSGYLWGVEPGAVVEFTGPHGNFVLPEGGGEALLFVARYTGVVPFRAMLRGLAASGGAGRVVHLVYSAPEPGEFVYRDEIAVLADGANWLTVDFPPDGGEFAALDAWIPPDEGFLPYVCGVREFTKPVRDYLMTRFGFDRRAVRLEHFS